MSLDIDTSINIEVLGDFKRRLKDALHQQIIKNNILIYDTGKFFGIITMQG